MFEKIKKFYKEVITEWSKVEWPTNKELIDSTLIVFVIIIIFGIYIFAVDYLINLFLDQIIKIMK